MTTWCAVSYLNPHAVILRSTDNGLNWNVIFTYVDDDGWSSLMSIANDGLGNWVAGTDYGYLYRSDDDGVNWTKVYDDRGVDDCEVDSLAAGLSSVWCAANIFDPFLLRSADSGANWTGSDPAAGEGGFQSIDTDDAGVWCMGEDGRARIFRSTDNGLIWTQVYSDTGGFNDWTLWCIASDKVGGATGTWCAGTRNAGVSRILRSTDNGATWAVAKTTTENSIRSIATNGSGRWCAGTASSGLIFLSTDDGVTWNQVYDSPTSSTILSIATDGSGIWCAGTSYGDIVRSDDDGATWVIITPDIYAYTYGIAVRPGAYSPPPFIFVCDVAFESGGICGVLFESGGIGNVRFS